MILDQLNHYTNLFFVDKYIRHMNHSLFCQKVKIWRRRCENTPMPRKKRAALASAENGKNPIEERPEKRMRIDTGRTPIAPSEEKEVC